MSVKGLFGRGVGIVGACALLLSCGGSGKGATEPEKGQGGGQVKVPPPAGDDDDDDGGGGSNDGGGGDNGGNLNALPPDPDKGGDPPPPKDPGKPAKPAPPLAFRPVCDGCLRRRAAAFARRPTGE